MPGSIILLSGPVAAGKTTVARELASIWREPVIHIDGDVFWGFLTNFERSSLKNFKTVMASMAAASIPFANAGYDVILDFSIPPWYIDTIRKIVAGRGFQLHYIVLRPTQETCAARAAAREEGRILDYAPYRELYADFESQGNAICEDSLPHGELARVAFQRYQEGLFRLHLD